MAAILDVKTFKFEDKFAKGAGGGNYFEYSFLDGKFLFVVKYAFMDNETQTEDAHYISK